MCLCEEFVIQVQTDCMSWENVILQLLHFFFSLLHATRYVKSKIFMFLIVSLHFLEMLQ